MGHFKPPLILAFPQKWQAWGSWCPMNCSCNQYNHRIWGMKRDLQKDMLCQSRIVWEAFLSVCKIETPILDGGNVFLRIYTHKDSTCFSPLWMDEAKFDHRILFRLLVWFYLGLQDVPGNSWIFAFPSLELQNSSRWCGCLRKNCWSFLRSRGYDECSPGELALGMEGPILFP